MAQRARPSRGAGRTGTRKPVTIDLEAKEVAAESGVPKGSEAGGGAEANPAEPVAMNQTSTEETGAADPGPSGKADADAVEKASRASTANQAAENRSAESTRAAPLPPKRGGVGIVFGGVLGGLIALVGAAGLQWVGLVPSLGTQAEQVDLTPIQQEIDAVRSTIAELAEQQAAAPGATTIPDEVLGQIDEAAQLAAGAQAGSGEALSAVDALASELAALQSAVSAGEAGEAPALEALTEQLQALEAQVETGAGQGSTELSETVQALRGDVDAAREQLNAIESQVTPVQEGLAALQTRLDEELATLQGRLSAAEETLAEGGADSATVARAVAAAGLKSAIDRGNAFATELEAYASVAGEDEIVAALRDFAAAGVPTVTQLADSFGPVANRIVATGQGLDESASIGDRLMASARGLVQVRPVGEAEGDTPGAIAARMEARLKEGDLSAALAEWDALPAAAQSVTDDFVVQVRARQSVDALVADALSAAMAATQPAGQTQ